MPGTTTKTLEQIRLEVHDFLTDMRRYYETEARKHDELGTYFHCRDCGYATQLSREELAKIEVYGWPTHCGVTMEIRR